MKTPRYTVGSVNGYSGHGGENSKWATIWYVHDRANCYRIIREFIYPDGQRRAEELAALLEEGAEGTCPGCGLAWNRRVLVGKDARYRWERYCSGSCQRRAAAKSQQDKRRAREVAR